MATEPIRVSSDDQLKMKDLIVNLTGWINYLWSKRWSLVLAGVIGGILGLAYALIKTPQYTAITTFVLERGEVKNGLSRLAGVAAIAGIDFDGSGGGLFEGDNILELYKSRTMIVETLLSKTDSDSTELLVERYIKFNKLNDKWKGDPTLSKLNFRHNVDQFDIKERRTRDSLLTKFWETIRDDLLTVDKPDKELSIIRVQITSPDEVFSKAFNDNLVNRVNDFYTQTKTQKTSNNIALLEAKVDSVRREMDDAIYSAVRVSDATPNLNPTRQVQRLAPAQGAQFSAETNKAILSQLLQNLELSKMTLAQEKPLIQIVDQPVYPLFVKRIGILTGIILGGILFGFLTLIALIVARWYKNVMNEAPSPKF